MKYSKMVRILIAVFSATMLVSSIYAETSEEKAMREDFSQMYKQIDQLGKDKDMSGLMRKADEISRNWKAPSMKYYGELTVRVCTVLRSDCAEKKIPIEEIRGIAERALQTYDPKKEDNISVESHYSLLCAVQGQYTYSKETTKGAMSDEKWVAKRKTEAERWMIVWDRMETAIDPKWDPNARLFAKVMPPAGTNLSPGASPDGIKDQALRAEYEKAIEENNLKIKHDSEQRQLQKLRKQFTRSLVRYFGGTYSVAPYNDEELEALLSRHIKDADIRSAILKAVKENKLICDKCLNFRTFPHVFLPAYPPPLRPPFGVREFRAVCGQ